LKSKSTLYCLSDIELIKRYKKSNNNKYLNEILTRHYYFSYCILYKYLKNNDLVLTNIEKLNSEIKTSIINSDISFYQSWLYKKIVEQISDININFEKNFSDINFNCDDFYLDENFINEIKDNLTQLNSEEKKCFTLFYLENKCIDEIILLSKLDKDDIINNLKNGKQKIVSSLTNFNVKHKYNYHCLTETLIKKYINKEIPDRSKNKIEKHIINCNLCNDFIEGIALMHQDNINIINDSNSNFEISFDFIDFENLKKPIIIALSLGVISYLGYSAYKFYSKEDSSNSNKTIVSDTIKKYNKRTIYEYEILYNYSDSLKLLKDPILKASETVEENIDDITTDMSIEKDTTLKESSNKKNIAKIKGNETESKLIVTPPSVNKKDNIVEVIKVTKKDTTSNKKVVKTDDANYFEKAQSEYKSKNYKNVVKLLENKANSENEKYHLGASYLFTGEPGKSIEILSGLTNSKTPRIKEASKYYLAKSYLKTGKKEEAIAILKEISDSGNIYKSKAKELLESNK